MTTYTVAHNTDGFLVKDLGEPPTHTEKQYMILLDGHPSRHVFATENEAVNKISAWSNHAANEKVLPRVEFVSEMYGTDTDYPQRNDSNEQGEP